MQAEKFNDQKRCEFWKRKTHRSGDCKRINRLKEYGLRENANIIFLQKGSDTLS